MTTQTGTIIPRANNKEGMTMNRKELSLVVDVETCGFFGTAKVYDLGLAVVERTTGRIIEKASLVIEEVFYGCKREMQTAYYAEKLPLYRAGIKAGLWDVVTFKEAYDLVNRLIGQYGIKRVYAYNAKFDRDALNSTIKYLTHGFVTEFFPESVSICCIWHLATVTIMRQKGYRAFCEEHGFVSDKGNLKTSAEACFAYINKTPEFEEEHTGLSDVLIEAAILTHAIRQHKPMTETINPTCWRIPQKPAA